MIITKVSFTAVCFVACEVHYADICSRAFEMKKDHKSHITIENILELCSEMFSKGEHGYALLIYLGSITGVKIGKLLKVIWKDILNNDLVPIQKLHIDGMIYPKTTNKFFSEFIAYCYRSMNKPELDSHVFVKKDGTLMTTNSLNRELGRFQRDFPAILGMPYPFETDTLRRVYGLEVFDKSGRQNAAVTYLRKHYKHGTEKITREFLMIPPKEKGLEFGENLQLYDPPTDFREFFYEI